MNIPASTYRIQLNRDFTFKDLEKIVGYLDRLGVSAVYASPVFQATPGSMHGYDVIDPHTINPEIGAPGDLEDLSRKLQEKKMRWLQDIVPNHMAFSTLNYRLMDVLERGSHSPYHTYFDINWHHPSPELRGRVMVPFLGNERTACIRDREIQLSFSDRGFTVNYYDHAYPVSISVYDLLIPNTGAAAADLEKAWQILINRAINTKDYREWHTFKTHWTDAILRDRGKLEQIEATVSAINADSVRLERLLDLQHYVLTFWKQTEKEINYRRFFTINDLVCLRMEDREVFDEYHAYLYRLYEQGFIQGLRIDHIDGLYDPARYLNRLRDLFGDGCYLIAEKILEAKEDMPGHWPVQGDSGYQFLAYVSQLLTNHEGANDLLALYHEFVPGVPEYHQVVFENKKFILENYMGGEWDYLVHYLFELQLQKDFEAGRLKRALALIMIALPVYRIYPRRIPLTGADLKYMEQAFEEALKVDSDCREELNYLKALVTTAPADESLHQRILAFLNRLMQFTGPLTAKGVEDTTFYVYNPLISHDEVGDAPSELGIATQAFHTRMVQRQKRTPLALNTTATHDTKRGEDARIRLNSLSEIPEVWEDYVSAWFKMNQLFHQKENAISAPGTNDEYFIYQAITGGFPEDLQVAEEWIRRLQDYLIKVVREAKVNSNWESPNENYESACKQFIEKILDEKHIFLPSFLSFIKKLLPHAQIYSLAQVLIKLTSPGIPDIYQGCELWDLSFVDPDNRRPVDYEKRAGYLDQLIQTEQEGHSALMSFLAAHRSEGMEKLYVTWKTLHFRRANQALFTEGDYKPLLTTEKRTAMAYARKLGDKWALIAVPVGLSAYAVPPTGGNGPDPHYILLPENAPADWTHVFTGDSLTAKGRISLDEVFRHFPVALLSNG